MTDTELPENRIIVYYDGACPQCRRERDRYEKLAGPDAVVWLDITGRDALLREQGIDPQAALLQLHVQDKQGRVHRELDAYRLLLGQITWLRPLAWLIGLPVIRPLLSALLHRWVVKRLSRDGRLPGQSCNSSDPDTPGKRDTHSQ
ncbi:MAG: DUF393 domain-containing protein [Oleiphilaceae bacterium]|nr:DUF393 domain-containing protein [Oleiphilaceae bacterium]